MIHQDVLKSVKTKELGNIEKNIFYIEKVDEKISNIEEQLQKIHKGVSFLIPDVPLRDITILEPQFHPEKKGLSSREGQARLLHDLASIELQAMELALRTLCEFSNLPMEFRDSLTELTLSEAKHLGLCLQAIHELGYQWGDWPIHLSLWKSVSSRDTLIERLFIVHRYLEGSGLDSASHLHKRLKGVPRTVTHHVLDIISEEEIDHVKFGSRWYRYFCEKQFLDPDEHFKQLIFKLLPLLPKRREPLDLEMRRRAFFSEVEIEVLLKVRK